MERGKYEMRGNIPLFKTWKQSKDLKLRSKIETELFYNNMDIVPKIVEEHIEWDQFYKEDLIQDGYMYLIEYIQKMEDRKHFVTTYLKDFINKCLIKKYKMYTKLTTEEYTENSHLESFINNNVDEYLFMLDKKETCEYCLSKLPAYREKLIEYFKIEDILAKNLPVSYSMRNKIKNINFDSLAKFGYSTEDNLGISACIKLIKSRVKLVEY